MGREQRDNWRFASQAGILASSFFMPPAAAYFALVAGNLIISAIFPQSKPKKKEVSPSYSWKHATNATANEDTPLPIIYGKARVKPVIKNRFITMEGNKQYLNVLYGFSGHRIDEISDTIAPEWSWYGRNYPNQQYYEVGDVVRTPSADPNYGNEPGKTYRCKKWHYSGYYMSARSGPEIDYLNTNYWKVWHGTAAITNILVDGMPLSNFITANSNDVRYETRPGLAQQSVITGFENTYSHLALNIYPEALFPSTPNFYKGAANSHFLYYNNTRYKIVYSGLSANYLFWTPGADSYTTGTHLSDKPADAFVIYSRYIATNYQWNVQVPSASEWYTTTLVSNITQNIELVLYFPDGMYGESMDGSLIDCQCGIFAQYRLYGSGGAWSNFDMPIHTSHEKVNSVRDEDGLVSFDFTSKTSTPFYKTFRAAKENELLTAGRYQVRVCTIGPRRVQVVDIASISYAAEDGDGELRGHTYPGEALLGLRILATGQLSGDIEVTAEVERSTVPVYNTRSSAWVNAAANAHGWAVYDILANGHPDHCAYPSITNDAGVIQPIYGCGVDKDRIDYETFRSWVTYVNGSGSSALGMELNIVFDAATTAWDAILQICQEGRGVVYPLGAKFFAVIDKAVTDAAAGGLTDMEVAQLFSVGSINRESFRQQWADKSKKVNAIETIFFDEDNNYERTEFVVRSSNFDAGTDNSVPTQLELIGTTSYHQAFAQAVFLLNNNELLNHVIVFNTDIEGMQAQVGDVIRVQHDSMVGQGGKVASYDHTTGVITLDKQVTIATGTTYEFLIQLSDGSLRMKTVTGGSPTSTINFGAGVSWGATNPAQYDNWAFGPVGESSKLFRIIDISMAGDYSRQLVCLEYNARVYQVDVNSTDSTAATAAKVAANEVAPAADISVAQAAKVAPNLGIVPFTAFNTASNLRLHEIISRNRTTGEYESSIGVSWDPLDGENWAEYEVAFRDVDASDLYWVGLWNTATTYDMYDKVIHNGNTYVSLINDNVGNTPI